MSGTLGRPNDWNHLRCRTYYLIMRRAFLFLLLAVAFPLRAQSDRGRPVILLVHGRGMLGRDTAGTRQLWFNGLKSGSTMLTRSPVIDERDVRVVWYADVLDPASTESCD